MRFGTGWTVGAAALWLTAAAWPQAALAQGPKQFEPLTAGGGRFDIIGGGNAARDGAASPQTLRRAPAGPTAAKREVPSPSQGSPPQQAFAAPKAATPPDPTPAAPAQDTSAQATPAPLAPASDASAQTAAPPSQRPADALGPAAAAPGVTDDAMQAVLAAAPPVDPIITGGVPAQPLQPRAVTAVADDNVRIAGNSHALMSEALRRARASLDEFLKAAAAPPEGTSGFAVKLLVGPKDAREALWVSALERRVQRNLLFGESERWSGLLANTPAESSALRVGDRIAFETSEIRDWTYVSADGRPMGNFTACALTAPEGRARLAELTQKTGLDCGWLAKVANTIAAR